MLATLILYITLLPRPYHYHDTNDIILEGYIGIAHP